MGTSSSCLSTQTREWNEEIQFAREMPQEGFEERIMRDQIIVRTNQDFIEAAVKGVK